MTNTESINYIREQTGCSPQDAARLWNTFFDTYKVIKVLQTNVSQYYANPNIDILILRHKLNEALERIAALEDKYGHQEHNTGD